MATTILAFMLKLEEVFPPGVSAEGGRRHHAMMRNTYGENDVLGLHLWVGGVSQCFFLDDADFVEGVDVLIAKIKGFFG